MKANNSKKTKVQEVKSQHNIRKNKKIKRIAKRKHDKSIKRKRKSRMKYQRRRERIKDKLSEMESHTDTHNYYLTKNPRKHNIGRHKKKFSLYLQGLLDERERLTNKELVG